MRREIKQSQPEAWGAHEETDSIMEQELGIPSEATLAREKAAYEGGFKGQPSDAFAPKGGEGKAGKGRKGTFGKASEVGKAGAGGNDDEHGNYGEARLAKEDGSMATLAKQATMAKAKHGNVGTGSKDGGHGTAPC